MPLSSQFRCWLRNDSFRRSAKEQVSNKLQSIIHTLIKLTFRFNILNLSLTILLFFECGFLFSKLYHGMSIWFTFLILQSADLNQNLYNSLPVRFTRIFTMSNTKGMENVVNWPEKTSLQKSSLRIFSTLKQSGYKCLKKISESINENYISREQPF